MVINRTFHSFSRILVPTSHFNNPHLNKNRILFVLITLVPLNFPNLSYPLPKFNSVVSENMLDLLVIVDLLLVVEQDHLLGKQLVVVLLEDNEFELPDGGLAQY